MGVHSGRFSVIDGVSTMRNWSINDTADTKAFAASNTKGATGRRRGNKDWTGNVGAYGGKPVHMPGDVFNFAGYTAPDNDTDGGTGAKLSGSAVVESVVINFNWDGGDIISHAINFGANGALTKQSGQVALTDTTDPDTPEIIDLPITLFSSGSGFVELHNALNATLTLKREMKTYRNSSTAGQTGRTTGNLDWSLSVAVQDSDPHGQPFQPNDIVQVRLYTSETEYWELVYGRVKEFTGIQVDRESGNIIGYTINIDMSTHDDSNNLGHILLPGGATYWPAA